ncbi:drug/metabolite transporter (DMT)-like permease [Aurantimicrobium minutum]|uniref:EamA family transporter n=1 Tax=Aurantimicrobium minutum TaxID=708131 RepID=UPI002475889D|nr:EamA family transporter [Aurantimicrobium minutum]MDH6532221.1 drug/metabolite transporter (DMT)-like permease [Aurantimicrobium minutum]
MLTVILGLSGALVFGSGDFLGGMASKRMGAFLATGIAGIVGLFVLVGLTFVIPGQISSGTIWWGLLSGVAGALAILLLYAALAIGPMSILSPLGALISAIFPVIWAIVVSHETLAWFGYLALGLGAIAIVLVAFTPEKNAVKPRLRGIIFASVSGLLIGVFLIIMDQVPADSGLYPLVYNRFVNIGIMFSAVAIMALLRWAHRKGLFGRDGTARADLAVGDAGSVDFKNGILFALGCGVLDSIGNALLLLGIQSGNLSVMSVLTAMYPAGTIILAAIVLREKITKLQLVGMVLALAAAGLLALS